MKLEKNDLDTVRKAGRAEGEIQALNEIAKEMRKSAGDAFAAGEDERARSLRDDASGFEARAKRKQNKADRQANLADEVVAKLEAPVEHNAAANQASGDQQDDQASDNDEAGAESVNVVVAQSCSAL